MNSECQCKYRRIHESMRDAFVVMDLRGYLIEWNPSCLEMLRYSAEELKGLTSGDLTPEKWHAAERQIFEQLVIPHGQPWRYEKELVRKDGTIFPVEMSVHLLHDRNSQPEAIWAFVRDISKRKRMEAFSREQEEFFRSVAENSGDFIAVLDVNGRRLYNSDSYEQLFGDTRYLFKTDSFIEVHPDDRDWVKRVFFETVNSGIGQRIKFRFLLPDGRVRLMESRGGVIRDGDGRVVRVVVVSNDITGRDG